MNDDTTPCAPLRPLDTMAAAYFEAVRIYASDDPRLPLDHSTPPRGLCCVPPPAMVTT